MVHPSSSSVRVRLTRWCFCAAQAEETGRPQQGRLASVLHEADPAGTHPREPAEGALDQPVGVHSVSPRL
eukprot:39167-Rhodomonas_salina.1